MKQIYKNTMFKVIVILLGITTCFVIGLILYSNTIRKNQIKQTYTIAQQLGHTPQTHLLESEQCWDIFPSHCGIFIHFATNLSREELEAQVNLLPLTQKWFGEIDGYTIFSNINLNSTRTLTANGNDGLANRLAIQSPLAHQWSFLDEQNRYWRISFFEITTSTYQYKIDNQPISGNIVTVMLQTK